MPHASGRDPFSRFELTSSTRTDVMFAQAGGSELRTELLSTWAMRPASQEQ